VGCNLTGVHRTIACFDCHRNGNFAGITAECAGCHVDDALAVGTHAARLNRCTGGGCHNTNSWKDVSRGGAGLTRESVCR
jgi:hypothetical protein